MVLERLPVGRSVLSDREPRFTGAEPIEQVLGKPGGN